ncbi:MAG TPA: BatD family protein [Candidatus Bathyarchaeia archaeon]|nr:BatD family protein [Candidatus Bathyarchaeia archaeon]
MRVLAAASLFLALLGSMAAADGPVSVAASVDKRGITIGDPIGLVLVVETDSGYHITDSGVGRIMDEFEVLEAIPPQVTRIANGRTRYTFRYRITAFRVGDLVFPPISVAYQSPAGVPGVAPTAEIPIVITSVIQAGEGTDDIKPAKPQLRLPNAAPQIPQLAIQVALAVVVLVMLALLIRQTRRAASRRPKDPELDEVLLTPAQRALAELNRVASLGLPEKGRYAEHYALLSRTLRAYVRDRFGLSAGERTPRELREDMLRAGIDRTEIATIYEILREGETARFRQAVSYPARAQHAVRSALDAMRRAAVAEQYELMKGQPS